MRYELKAIDINTNEEYVYELGSDMFVHGILQYSKESIKYDNNWRLIVTSIFNDGDTCSVEIKHGQIDKWVKIINETSNTSEQYRYSKQQEDTNKLNNRLRRTV